MPPIAGGDVSGVGKSIFSFFNDDVQMALEVETEDERDDEDDGLSEDDDDEEYVLPDKAELEQCMLSAFLLPVTTRQYEYRLDHVGELYDVVAGLKTVYEEDKKTIERLQEENTRLKRENEMLTMRLKDEKMMDMSKEAKEEVEEVKEMLERRVVMDLESVRGREAVVERKVAALEAMVEKSRTWDQKSPLISTEAFPTGMMERVVLDKTTGKIVFKLPGCTVSMDDVHVWRALEVAGNILFTCND